MNDAPDSEAENCDSIVVIKTPTRDNPKYGAVTVELVRGRFGNTIRLSREDAHVLLSRLIAHLGAEHGAA